MRHSRVMYPGAYHHITARAYGGINIFDQSDNKQYLLKLLKQYSERYIIRLLGICIMDNHYHLVLQDILKKLPDFMRDVNGNYGLVFRKKNGSHGYVFGDRYYSKIIQNDSYMKTALLYVLLNPVRAGIVNDAYDYKYSSIHEIFNRTLNNPMTDSNFIEELFVDERNFRRELKRSINRKLPVVRSRYCDIIGEQSFEEDLKELFERRRIRIKDHPQLRRRYKFKKVDEIIAKFEKHRGLKISQIDIRSRAGKTVRGELLVKIYDNSELTFKEINTINIFKSLRLKSLSVLYRLYKNKHKKKH